MCKKDDFHLMYLEVIVFKKRSARISDRKAGNEVNLG